MVDIVVGNVNYPDVRGMDVAAAIAALQAVYINPQFATPQVDPSNVDTVIAQTPDPSATPTVDPSSVIVTLTLSLGDLVAAGRIRSYGRRRGRRIQVSNQPLQGVKYRASSPSDWDKF